MCVSVCGADESLRAGTDQQEVFSAPVYIFSYNLNHVSVFTVNHLYDYVTNAKIAAPSAHRDNANMLTCQVVASCSVRKRVVNTC